MPLSIVGWDLESRTLRAALVALGVCVGTLVLPSAARAGPPHARASLRAVAAFVEARPAPTSCSAPEYRKFDFWIGDWDVFVNDRLAGHNLVTREQDGCLLVEHWTSNGGGQSGTSFNYYDIRDRKWHQLYLDNTGNAGNFPPLAGDLVDGKMVLFADSTAKPLSRWTWYTMAPGKVKQMSETSTDKGATWRTVWNSVYVRKQPSR